MPTNRKALSERWQQIDQLKNELARLDGIYAQHLKAMGLNEDDLKKIDPDSLPPEAKAIMDQARQAALREGAERARAARSQAAPTRPPTRRRGAVMI